MDDHIGIIDEFGQQLAILDVVEMILQALGGFQMTNVFDAAGGKVVEQDDAVAAVEKPLREVRTNKTSAASDQIAQRTSLKGLGVIVAIARDAMGNGIGNLWIWSLHSFL